MAPRISAIVPLLIITVLCIAAVEGGYRILEHYIIEPPAVVPVPKEAESVNDPVQQSTQKKQYDHKIIFSRQLFGPPPKKETQNRVEPFPKSSKERNPVEKSDSEVILVGTMTGEKKVSRAFIYNKNNSKQELYREGEYIVGKMVKEIKKGRVILSSEGDYTVLDISEAATIRPQNSAPVKQRIRRRLPIRQSKPINKAIGSQKPISPQMIPEPAPQLIPKQ